MEMSPPGYVYWILCDVPVLSSAELMNQSLREAIFNRRMFICVLTGLASGMPLYLLMQLVPAWLRSSGVSLADIGLMALVGLPYSWKFLWAPLMDRFSLPLGRRRGWMLITQIGLILGIGSLGYVDPSDNMALVAAFASVIAFLSASQDVAIDAYRREILSDEELGLGNAIHVQAYRIASLVPGSLSLVLADSLPWVWVFWITAAFMAVGLVLSLSVTEPGNLAPQPRSLREAFIAPFSEYVTRSGWRAAALTLFFMVAYKLGDNMATALATPFYLDVGVHLDRDRAGRQAGSAVGLSPGAPRWRHHAATRHQPRTVDLRHRANDQYSWLRRVGEQWPKLWLLAAVIAFEYLGVGLGTTAFTAFIARESSRAFAATQFALFTAFAVLPRSIANASTGFIVEGIGWVHFFLLCTVLAIPGMVALVWVAPWRVTESRP